MSMIFFDVSIQKKTFVKNLYFRLYPDLLKTMASSMLLENNISKNPKENKKKYRKFQIPILGVQNSQGWASLQFIIIIVNLNFVHLLFYPQP